jgi:chromosome segregation ATPase
MSNVYESLKDVVPVTSNPFARIKGNALTLNDAMEQLEKFVAGLEKQTNQLHQAIQQTKEEAASEAKRVEHLTETFKAQIAALEAQLRKTEETAREKDSTIKALEEDLTGKIQDSESQEKLLAERETQVNDLNSQVQVLTKRIKDMSSFFRQAEALAVVETQDIGTLLQAGESKNEQDKPATLRIDSPKVMSNKTDQAQETVSLEFFDRVTNELTQLIGPMASLIIRDHVEAIGESIEKFPQTRVTELLKIVSEEIPDKNRKNSFRERLEQSPAPVRVQFA